MYKETVGRLNDEQVAALAPHVKGRVVHDLGAGDLVLAQLLVKQGAEKVVAVDRYTLPGEAPAGIEVVEAYFEDYYEPIDVAFMSWPVNWVSGLHALAARARTAIYLGKNTDGSCCGDSILFHQLWQREVLAHVPDRPNTLIIYGPKFVTRDMLPEERTHLDDPDTMWAYDELMAGV